MSAEERESRAKTLTSMQLEKAKKTSGPQEAFRGERRDPLRALRVGGAAA
jgi:hypothetical protein